jgi:hypothetical protein
MRNALWHEVMTGAPGFTGPEIYPPVEQTLQRHPSELGHKYMADVAVGMVQQAYVAHVLEPLDMTDTWVAKLMQVRGFMYRPGPSVDKELSQ